MKKKNIYIYDRIYILFILFQMCIARVDKYCAIGEEEDTTRRIEAL